MIEQLLQTLRSPRFYLALSLSTVTAALVAVPLGIQAVQVREEQILSLGAPAGLGPADSAEPPGPSTVAPDAEPPSTDAATVPTTEPEPPTAEESQEPPTTTETIDPELPIDDPSEIAAPAAATESTTASSVTLPEPIDSSDVSVLVPTTPLGVKPGPSDQEPTSVTTATTDPTQDSELTDGAAKPDPAPFDPSAAASTPTTIVGSPATPVGPAAPTTPTTVGSTGITVADPTSSATPPETTIPGSTQPSTTVRPTTGGSTVTKPPTTTASQPAPIDSRVQFPVQAS